MKKDELFYLILNSVPADKLLPFFINEDLNITSSHYLKIGNKAVLVVAFT